MCGAPVQGRSMPGVDLDRETVICGQVTHDGQPVPAAFVRLLDADGEFTAEVTTSASGEFRFFAAPGNWTVRALSRQGNGQSEVAARVGLTETQLEVAAG